MISHTKDNAPKTMPIIDIVLPAVSMPLFLYCVVLASHTLSPLEPSTKESVAQFQQILEQTGVTCTVRRTLGSNIDASCGQLRRNYAKTADS